MSLKLRDFAKSDGGSANLSNGNLVEESSDEDISYLPPGKTSWKEMYCCEVYLSFHSNNNQLSLKCIFLVRIPRERDERKER